MHPYIVYGLIAVLVILCVKSLLTVWAKSYLEEFFNDPTGGIIPIDEIKKK